MKSKHLLLIPFLFINGCSSMDLTQYQSKTPDFDFSRYFDGEVKAWGLIQDWRGNVVDRFDIQMIGHWQGEQGTLEEEFVFYDGKTQHRTWNITKTANNQYTATADDLIGIAEGSNSGNAIRWNYQMDITVKDSTYRISFDDWMWLLNDGVIINRSYMKKFGFTVGELTVFMKKSDPAASKLQKTVIN